MALFGTAFPLCAAPLVECPQHLREGTRNGGLETASVFDGSPENKVDLMPDLSTSVWDLSTEQESARARNDSMFLVCRYKGIKSTVTRKIPYEATLCKIEGNRNRALVTCSGARNESDVISK
jgi:hypothetical protein